LVLRWSSQALPQMITARMIERTLGAEMDDHFG
jgi:hypothetical protein